VLEHSACDPDRITKWGDRSDRSGAKAGAFHHARVELESARGGEARAGAGVVERVVLEPLDGASAGFVGAPAGAHRGHSDSGGALASFGVLRAPLFGDVARATVHDHDWKTSAHAGRTLPMSRNNSCRVSNRNTARAISRSSHHTLPGNVVRLSTRRRGTS